LEHTDIGPNRFHHGKKIEEEKTDHTRNVGTNKVTWKTRRGSTTRKELASRKPKKGLVGGEGTKRTKRDYVAECKRG